MPATPPPGEGYAIGTVSGLTGLDPHTIRAWERRHGAVHPLRRPGGARRYRDEDVARLQLLKALTERGEGIGRIAHLDDDSLRERLRKVAGAGAPQPRGGGLPRVALLAPGLAAQLGAQPTHLGRFPISVRAADVEAARAGLALHRADALVVERELLGSDPLGVLGQLQREAGARLALVIHQFARRSELSRLRRAGVRLLRAPLRSEQVVRALDDLLAIDAAGRGASPAAPPAEPEDGQAPPRIFDDRQLAQLLEARSGVECECPNHLSTLVASTLAFERYSLTCESRSPEDAAMHRHLALGTARVRRALEELLLALCEHDDLPVVPRSSP